MATNPLGEAVCQAQFVIEPGEGGGNDLFLPDLWKNGKRLNWAEYETRYINILFILKHCYLTIAFSKK